jgi:4'-phosphopantetheinyl transferase EntD
MRKSLTSKVVFVSTNISYNNEYLYRMSSIGIRLPPQMVSEAVLKRKCEFAAGRYCAFEALQSLGISIPIDIPVGPNREPVWPANTIGSISHCQGIAVAVAAHRSDVTYLGVDIEPLISPEICDQIWHCVVCEKESKFSKGFSSRETFLTVVFSAKEALYKALFPIIKQVVGFDAVKVSGLEVKKQIMSLSLNFSFDDSLTFGQTFLVHYQAYSDQTILTFLHQEREK